MSTDRVALPPVWSPALEASRCGQPGQAGGPPEFPGSGRFRTMPLAAILLECPPATASTPNHSARTETRTDSIPASSRRSYLSPLSLKWSPYSRKPVTVFYKEAVRRRELICQS